MRNLRLRFLAGGIGAVVLAVIACGGSSENAPGGTADAGGPDTNVPDTNVPDTNVPDTSDSAAPPVVCVDASLASATIPDASLNDSGATTGTCLECVNSPTNCGADVTACQGDCTCLNAIICIYQHCPADFGNQTALITCAATNNCIDTSLGLAGIPQSLVTLGSCISSKCGSECGVPPVPDAGPDANDASDDGPTDAPTDG